MSIVAQCSTCNVYSPEVDIFLHPILLLGFGPAAGFAVGLLLTRPLMQRGQRGQAVLAGLLVLGVLFGLQQLSLRAEQLAEFADSGPCPTCAVWNLVPHLVNWVTWGVGAVAFALISVATASKLAPERSPAPFWSRRQVAPWVVGILIAGALAWGSNRVVRGRQQTALAELMQQPARPIAGIPNVEVGKLRLPQGGFGLDFAYAVELTFSPDGRWLVVHHSDGWDLWRLPDIRLLHSLHGTDDPEERWLQLSPEASLLADIDLGLTVRGDTEVYQLDGNELNLLWRGGQNGYHVYRAAFSPDGEELRILDSSERLIRLDAQTGQVLQSIPLSFTPPLTTTFTGSRLQGQFNRSGAYLALADSLNCKVGLFAVETGEQLGAWDPSDGACPGVDDPDWGYVAFRPDDLLVWIREYDLSADRILWAPPGGRQLFLEDALAQYPGPVGFSLSPDWRLAVFAEEKTVNIWDLETERAFGSFDTDAVVTAVEFTSDGALLAVGTADGYLRFFSDR